MTIFEIFQNHDRGKSQKAPERCAAADANLRKRGLGAGATNKQNGRFPLRRKSPVFRICVYRCPACKVEKSQSLLILFASSTIIDTRFFLRGVLRGLYFHQTVIRQVGALHAADSNSMPRWSHPRCNEDCKHLGCSLGRREAKGCQN